jgi:hypothetical protein
MEMVNSYSTIEIQSRDISFELYNFSGCLRRAAIIRGAVARPQRNAFTLRLASARP